MTTTEYRTDWDCIDCGTAETVRAAYAAHYNHTTCTPDDCPVAHAMHFDALLDLPAGHTA